MSKKTDKRSRSTSRLRKSDVLQAVIVTDSFNKNFAPASSCSSLLPLVNKKLLDYTLEWLNMSGVNEVILFCSSCANEIKNHVQSKVYLGIDINVLVSEDCRSFGDVMRAIDRCAVIRNTFVMLTADVVGNVNFLPLIEKFKKIAKADKEACMMLLFKEIGNRRTDFDNNFILAYNSKNRILHYQVENSKEIELPMDVLLDQNYVEIKNDLSNLGVAICSVAVPPLFSDNFDVQTINEFVRRLLVNDEVAQSTVYGEILKKDDYIARVKDWRMYQIVSQDVIRRWTYPMVPDVTEKYSYGKNSVYLKDVTFCKGCKLNYDVVIGSETKLKKHVSVANSVIGRDCIIGENAVIENSYIFDNVKIDEHCVIRFSVIGENCHIKKKCKLDRGCILGPNVTLKSETNLQSVKVMSKKSEKDGPASGDAWVTYETSDSEGEEISDLVANRDLPSDVTFEDTSSDSESELSESESLSPAVELDDVRIFYDEIFDLLCKGFAGKLKCENLILEINSSRYANEVTVDDVNCNVVRAILNIETKMENPSPKERLQHMHSKLKYFLPIMKNYIKDVDTQHDCLTTIMEVAFADKNLKSLLIWILQFLYNEDVLAKGVILVWYSRLTNNEYKRFLNKFVDWLNQDSEESD